MTGGKRLRIAALFVIVLVFAFIMDMSSNAITDNTLTRNDTGDGDAVYDLVLNADGLDEDYSYQLKVREEQPSDKQANELFTQAKKEIDDSFCEKGQSVEQVRGHINMKDAYALGAVEAEWTLSDYDVVDINGDVNQDAFEEVDDKIDFSKLDIVLLGGGSDREQMIVCEKLQKIQPDFKAYVEDNGVVIAICGGYQLLGKYYKTDQGNMKGLDLVDLYTEQGEGRLIQNIVLQSELFDMPIVGFENHGGRTCINNNKPLGKVLYGAGNDGKSGYEGVVYKNVIGTYLHGPLLPKNPQLADWLIQHALERKYGKETELTPLDDSQEKEANDYIYHRFVRG